MYRALSPLRQRVIRRTQAGVNMLETLLVVGALAVLMLVLSSVITSFGNEAKYQMAAKQLLQVQLAAEQFVKTNFTQLTDPLATGNIAAIGDTRMITVAALAAQNYLPVGVTDYNVLGLRMRVFLRNDTAAAPGSIPAIQIVVATDPPSFAAATDTGPDYQALMGSAAYGKGRIGILSNVGDTFDTNRFRSTTNQWSISRLQLAGYAPPLPPTPFTGAATGYLASFGRMTSEDIFDPNVLYRVPIAGHADYNEMNTTLNMDGNNMLDVKTVTADRWTNTGAVTINAPAGGSVSYGLSTEGKLETTSANLHGDNTIYADENAGTNDLYSGSYMRFNGPATFASTKSDNLIVRNAGLIVPTLTTGSVKSRDLVVNNTLSITNTALQTSDLQLGGAGGTNPSLRSGSLSTANVTAATTAATGQVRLPRGNHSVAANARVGTTAVIPAINVGTGVFQDLCYTTGPSSTDRINGC